MPSCSFPCLHVHTPGETVDDQRLVQQKAIQSSTGVQRLPETWCARLPARLQHRANGGRDWACSLVPASGVFCQNGSLFPPDLTGATCTKLGMTWRGAHQIERTAVVSPQVHSSHLETNPERTLTGPGVHCEGLVPNINFGNALCTTGKHIGRYQREERTS